MKKEKPLFDNRDMCMAMCIICASLITYIMFSSGFIIASGIQLIIAIIAYIFAISYVLFKITQKIVRACYFQAKRREENAKAN